MTDKQNKAIAAANKALKDLHKSGVLICGMNYDILYATKKACDKRRNSSTKDYCPVANACHLGDDDTGHLYSGGYQDSGGW